MDAVADGLDECRTAGASDGLRPATAHQRNGLSPWTPFLIGAAAMAAGLVLMGATGRDDCYISYWPARTLAHDGQILNYNGDRVEQSSSLLHTLLLGLLTVLTRLEPDELGRPLSMLFGGASIVAVWFLARRVKPGREALAAAIAAMALPLFYWSFGGLESTIASFLVTMLCIALMDRRPALTAIWAGLLVITRPEMPIVLAVAILGMATIARQRWIWGPLASVVLVFAAVTAWRLWYFGSPLPQPVLAKGGAPLSWQDTRDYLAFNWPAVIPLAFLLRRQSGPLLWIALPLLAFALARPDWMEGGRFFVPLVPLAAVGFAIALPYAGLALYLLWTSLFLIMRSAGMPIWSVQPGPAPYWERACKTHLRDLPAAHELVKLVGERIAQRQRATVLSGQMGLVSYYVARAHYRRVRLIDRNGLADRTLQDSALGKNLMPGKFGLHVSFPSALSVCDPDFLYDQGAFDTALSDRFRPVYTREDVVVGPPELPGLPHDARQFIAVRR